MNCCQNVTAGPWRRSLAFPTPTKRSMTPSWHDGQLQLLWIQSCSRCCSQRSCISQSHTHTHTLLTLALTRVIYATRKAWESIYCAESLKSSSKICIVLNWLLICKCIFFVWFSSERWSINLCQFFSDIDVLMPFYISFGWWAVSRCCNWFLRVCVRGIQRIWCWFFQLALCPIIMVVWINRKWKPWFNKRFDLRKLHLFVF